MGSVRVLNREEGYISYRLNILGVRVWKDCCQLSARDGRGRWMPLGAPRPLPIVIPDDPIGIGSDTLLLTAFQYDAERPGTDLRKVLSQEKDFDAAFVEENAGAKAAPD